MYSALIKQLKLLLNEVAAACWSEANSQLIWVSSGRWFMLLQYFPHFLMLEHRKGVCVEGGIRRQLTAELLIPLPSEKLYRVVLDQKRWASVFLLQLKEETQVVSLPILQAEEKETKATFLSSPLQQRKQERLSSISSKFLQGGHK